MKKLLCIAALSYSITAFAMDNTNIPQRMVLLDHQSYEEYHSDLSRIVEIGQQLENPQNNIAYKFYAQLKHRCENPLVDSYQELFSSEEQTYINQQFTKHFDNLNCKYAYDNALTLMTADAWDDFVKKAIHAGKLIGQELGVLYSQHPGSHNYLEFLELNKDIQYPAIDYLKCGAIIFFLKQMKRLNVKPALQS